MKEAIDLAFEELQRFGQIRGRSDFSSRWLGREASYYRSIQSKGLSPSVQAHAHLAARLRDLGMHLGKSDHPKLSAVGDAFLKLYGSVLDSLLNRAQSDAIDLKSADVECIG